MKSATVHSLEMNGQQVDYRVVTSRTARRLRVRVGLDGIEVVLPRVRTEEEAAAFLRRHEEWVGDQMARVDRLRVMRRPLSQRKGEMLFRGVATPVRVVKPASMKGANRIEWDGSTIEVRQSRTSRTPVTKSLENWLRKQVRADIEAHLAKVSKRLGRAPNQVYVMAQRTKWGNCSALRNLSFNWRLILAPEYVLRYLVTHEAVHLAVPDHSAKFWLTVQSLCSEMEKAKAWLRANDRELKVNLQQVTADLSFTKHITRND
jgi:predicted metal-dependent hydrolase